MKRKFIVPIEWSDEVGMKRVVVHCMGDIAVDWFFDGDDPDFVDPEHGVVGWVLLSEGPEGQIGRKTDQKPVELSTCNGVLIGVSDPRSFDVLADAFAQIAHAMRAKLDEDDNPDDNP